ncbi:acireductone synthase [Shewanella sp. Choline-02u-19]|jgi:enolase-phosphatase E1|uniref:acireductone synthase n=1 Tax=unclassified Shewanella TaxID=196818 RepID=UPI000C34DAB7|nr:MULTISPECIES: acireductone synthase [unclassified Shewanella]PKG56841.1 acireductone synthase [Shewanella sp. GutDb-MelDb]PKG74659.1 acireductone synthase [Shewanella sp. GutCb]PKH56054.1 acireductone synthase [Shewanella sp. Bg11-22]PKI30643.1 acireductone synthase [Shewanella sp. Choline-02u-19]
MGIRAIVVDTAGTTTDLNFIEDILFPYSAKALPAFLEENQHNVLVENCICDVQDIALEPDADLARVTEILLQWISEDRKATPLKTIQGLIWKQGYANGEFKGHIFPDFIEALDGYKQKGLRVYSFSSGSVDAQKLLFGNSDAGDLTDKFNGHFDTRTGNKRFKQAYCNILNTISLSPKQILFVSDVLEELKAASEAGLNVAQMVRDDSQRTGDFKQVSSFAELDI